MRSEMRCWRTSVILISSRISFTTCRGNFKMSFMICGTAQSCVNSPILHDLCHCHIHDLLSMRSKMRSSHQGYSSRSAALCAPRCAPNSRNPSRISFMMCQVSTSTFCSLCARKRNHGEMSIIVSRTSFATSRRPRRSPLP